MSEQPVRPKHRFDGYLTHPDRPWRRVKCACGWKSMWSDTSRENDEDLQIHLDQSVKKATQ